MRSKRGFIVLAIMFSVLLISGCGGGGGGSSASAPSAPTGVTATAGNGAVSIAWTAVNGATSYNVYYSATDNVTKATGTKVTGVTSPNIVAGLTNGTPYFFVVTAVNAVGESADSSEVTATPALASPAAPTGVAATAGHGEATIGWDNVAGATSYNIYHSATTGVTKATGTKVTGVTSPSIVTGLTNGTPRFFVVTAVNAAGESVISAEVTATPTAAPGPAAPVGVAATAGSGQATIGWDNVTGATSYNIYYDNTTGVTKATGTKITGVTSPRIVTGLTNGTPYFFVVTAVNADGESVESSQVTATPTAAPATAAPAGVTATAGSGQATIGWDNVTGATSFNIYYSTTTGVTKATGTKVAGVTSPRIVAGLIRGTPYFFVVTALNSDNVESADSSQVTATPNPPTPTYSQADLTGIWNVRVILSGASPGWYGGTATVDSSGNITAFTDSSPAGPTTPPAVSGLSITSGTDNAAGVVTEMGTDNNVTFFGKMSTSKNLIVGTSTDGANRALHVFVKRVPGVTFSSADLANTTFAYQRIYRGTSLDWERGTGSTNGAGLMTLTSAVNSSGAVFPLPSATNISVDSTTGIVSIAAESTFAGVMTSDKKIIVGTSTDAAGTYSLRIIQMRGQTYTLADLAGVNHAFAFSATSASSEWAYSIWTTDGSGNVTYESIVNSTPPDSGPGSFTQAMDAQGNAPDGTMSFGKDLLVTNGTVGDGSYIEIKVQ
jgi:hypothetical protein